MNSCSQCASNLHWSAVLWVKKADDLTATRLVRCIKCGKDYKRVDLADGVTTIFSEWAPSDLAKIK
jgi:hypothetical protein